MPTWTVRAPSPKCWCRSFLELTVQFLVTKQSRRTHVSGRRSAFRSRDILTEGCRLHRRQRSGAWLLGH